MMVRPAATARRSDVDRQRRTSADTVPPGKEIMSTLLIAIASFVGFFIAYHTYGRWLSAQDLPADTERGGSQPPTARRRGLRADTRRRSSLATTSRVSPAPGRSSDRRSPCSGAGCRPCCGSCSARIFIGAVHDFGALVVSLAESRTDRRRDRRADDHHDARKSCCSC